MDEPQDQVTTQITLNSEWSMFGWITEAYKELSL